MRRTELEASANFDRWNVGVLYGDYAAQPLSASSTGRQGILGSGSVKLDANWVLLGAARYDINADKFDQTRIGLGYIDDCLILALNYITNYSYGSGVPVLDHTNHAAVEPAHAGRDIGQPRRRERGRHLNVIAAAMRLIEPGFDRHGSWTLRCQEQA